MFPRISLAVVLFLLPAAVDAQEVFKIDLKRLPKGGVSRVEKKETEVQNIKVADNTGQLLEAKEESTLRNSVYVETILERPNPDKKATALKRAYEKAEVTRDKEKKVLPYQGKTIIIELKDGKYQFRIDGGGPITGEDASSLEQEFNKDDEDMDMRRLLLPAKPVAINESWKVQMPAFLKAFEKVTKMTADEAKSTGTGTLVKAFKKDGRQYGDMKLNVDLPLKTLRTDQGDITFQPGGTVKVSMTITACIDGSLEDWNANMTMTFDGLALIPSADNPMARLEFAIRGDIEGGTREITK